MEKYLVFFQLFDVINYLCIDHNAFFNHAIKRLINGKMKLQKLVLHFRISKH